MRLIDADKLTETINKALEIPSYNTYQDGYDTALNTLLDYIADMPTLPAPQWISVEDNPPGNEYDFVLAYKPYLHEMGGSGMIVEHPWFVRMNKTYKYWMPLPEPPKEV